MVKIKTKTCIVCNKLFEYKDTKRNANRQCCSHLCAVTLNGRNNKGKVRSEEFKKEYSKRFSGNKNPFYGQHHSKETKKTISIKNTWKDSDFQYCNLSVEMMEVLDGLMLADASLEESKHSARITYGCKFKETLEDIQKSFPSFRFSNIWKSPKWNSYHFKSSYYKNLKAERERWYPSGIKEVPDDIRITPSSCYWWFVGDGYQVDYGVMLCTDAYSQKSITKLIEKLSEKGFASHLQEKGNRIRIESQSSLKFLNWIKNNCPISNQYIYKWGNHKKQNLKYV